MTASKPTATPRMRTVAGAIPTGIILHEWEHCPYCVRVHKAFAKMGLQYQAVESPPDQSDVYAMLGARQVPAIRDTETGVMMLESLDIIAYARKTYAAHAPEAATRETGIAEACPLPRHGTGLA